MEFEQVLNFLDVTDTTDLDRLFVEDELLFQQYQEFTETIYLSNGVIVAY